MGPERKYGGMPLHVLRLVQASETTGNDARNKLEAFSFGYLFH
jgi:hypothetical protein